MLQLRSPLVRRLLLTTLIFALLLSAGYLGKRWWQKRSYVADLPAINRTIDGQALLFKTHFECLPNIPSCPRELTSRGAYAFRVLGNPAATRYPRPEQWPARTPWDLFIADHRIYIGLGDDSNEGPTANAGPVPLLAYDTDTGQFIEASILPEEQIDRFYKFNNQLLIPGDDPRESWDWGNLYLQQNNGQWQQRRTLPRFIHAHALTFYKGLLYAGGNIPDAVPPNTGAQRHGSALAASPDWGMTWSTTGLGGWRITEFLQVNGQLYAADALPGPGLQAWLDKQGRQDFYSALYQLDAAGQWVRRIDINAPALLPDTALAGKRMAQIVRTAQWKSATVYIAAFDPQADSLAVRAAYMANNLDKGLVQVRRLPFDDNAQVWDIAVEDNQIWVATSTPKPNGRWLNELHSSPDGRHWKTTLSFEAPTYAISFARFGTSIYWGLAGEGYAGTLLEFYPN